VRHCAAATTPARRLATGTLHPAAVSAGRAANIGSQEHNSELDATSGAGVMLAHGAVIAPGHAGVLIAGAQFQWVIA